MSRGQAVADIGRKRTPPPSASRAGFRQRFAPSAFDLSQAAPWLRHHRTPRPGCALVAPALVAPRLSVRQAVRHHRTRRALVAPPWLRRLSIRRPFDRAGSVPPDSGDRAPRPASGLSAIPANNGTPRRQSIRRPFDRAGSVRRIPANVSERRKRASRPPFDRAPRLSAVRPCAASRFRPVSGSTVRPCAAGFRQPSAPSAFDLSQAAPASDSPPPSASLSGNPSAPFAASPPPSPETRRKRPPLRPPAPDGFAPVPPCRALTSPFQAV